jgi:hypothetical protein
MLVAAVALVTTGGALADHSPPDGAAVTPDFIAGKVSNECAGGTKLDGSEDGGPTGDLDSGMYVFTIGSFTFNLQITVVQTASGPTFTFQSLDPSEFITGIYVKGGPNGSNFYDYVNWDGAGADGIGHDDGLHSPLNSNNGKWYGLSHICFFADKK